MNEYEIDDMVEFFNKAETPNLHAAALALSRLRGWTNSISDGWQYWSKPKAAAARLIGLLTDAERQYRKDWEWADCTEAQLKAALSPVKAFLTRQKVNSADVLNPPPPVDRLRQIKAAVWQEGWEHYNNCPWPANPEYGKNPYLND